jgi:endonuclease G
MPKTRAERAAAFLKDIAGEEGLDALRVDAAAADTLNRQRRQQEAAMGIESMSLDIDAATINGALESVMTDRPLAPDQTATIEAIIIPDKRPVMPLKAGSYTATHKLWLHLNDKETKARLTRLAKSIGRIEVPGSKYPYGGTGFVVGPGLVMTNRHVAEIFTEGVGTRQLAFIPGVSPGFSSAYAPDNSEIPVLTVADVVMVHPYWDMALLKVEGLAADMAPLTLAGSDIAGFDKHEIAVIGYPGFDPRNDIGVQKAVFDNRFGVKQLQPGTLRERADTESFSRIVNAVTHDCSTLGGNSGSALIHIESGKVLALHFGGEYLARNYAVPASELGADGRVFDTGVQFDSNKPDGLPPWSGFWTGADSGEAPRRSRAADAAMTAGKAAADGNTAADAGGTPSASSGVRSGACGVDITIPLHITVRLGGPAAPAVVAVSDQAPAGAGASIERLVEPAHDTNYANRRGYNDNFLGIHVPFPEPADSSVLAPTRSGGSRLDYQHFSLLVHARRRLALVTAANVTADKALKEPERDADYSRKALGELGKNDQEKWFVDERMDAAFQLPDVFYTRDDGSFDKGHIVRREDVAWGRTLAEVKRANGDTFHVTNCSPQIAVFNRSTLGRENWGDLEDVVLKNAASEKLCVFGGPVLDASDPHVLGNFGRGDRRMVQVPVKFWKVIVAKAVTGLAAFGFVLEQDLSDVATTEFAVPDAFSAFLVSVDDISTMAGVTFADAIVEADQFEGRGREIALRAGVGVRAAPRRR